MKHLPNLLTLANLFCGCIAITFILSAQNFSVASPMDGYIEVTTSEQPYMGSLFILLAGIFDMLDGTAARALKIYSPIGKDLDSLADIVSFGVAPAMILFKLLWSAYMHQQDAMDINMLAVAPAFLIVCFAALRLAKFNITANEQKGSFKGLPVPAVGIFVASLPLIDWYNPYHISQYLQLHWSIYYLIIALLCWLMVSNIRFFKLMPSKFKTAYMWPQIILVIVTLATLPILKIAAIPLAFIVYILLSFIYKSPETVAAE